MKFDPDNRNGRKEIMRFAQTIIQMRQPESSIFVVDGSFERGKV